MVGESHGYSKKIDLSSPTKDMKLLAFNARALWKDLPLPAAVNNMTKAQLNCFLLQIKLNHAPKIILFSSPKVTKIFYF